MQGKYAAIGNYLAIQDESNGNVRIFEIQEDYPKTGKSFKILKIAIPADYQNFDNVVKILQGWREVDNSPASPI